MANALWASNDLASCINEAIVTGSSTAVLKWAFDLVACKERSLTDFVMQFVPALSWIFLLKHQSPTPSTGDHTMCHALSLM